MGSVLLLASLERCFYSNDCYLKHWSLLVTSMHILERSHPTWGITYLLIRVGTSILTFPPLKVCHDCGVLLILSGTFIFSSRQSQKSIWKQKNYELLNKHQINFTLVRTENALVLLPFPNNSLSIFRLTPRWMQLGTICAGDPVKLIPPGPVFTRSVSTKSALKLH